MFFGWGDTAGGAEGTFHGTATYSDDEGDHDVELLDIRVVAGHLLVVIKGCLGSTYRYVLFRK